MLLRAFLIWGICLILECIVVVLVIPPTLIINAANKEETSLINTLGEDAAQKISIQARDTFNEWFIDTGIMAESFDLFVPTEATKRASTGLETLAEGLFSVVQKRLESAWNLVFVAIQRAYAFLAWLPLLLPFLIACSFDGGTTRRIKLLTFGISSAPIYGATIHALILLAFLPLFYGLWPFAAPPLFVPCWFIGLSLVSRSLIANLQRM